MLTTIFNTFPHRITPFSWSDHARVRARSLHFLLSILRPRSLSFIRKSTFENRTFPHSPVSAITWFDQMCFVFDPVLCFSTRFAGTQDQAGKQPLGPGDSPSACGHSHPQRRRAGSSRKSMKPITGPVLGVGGESKSDPGLIDQPGVIE